MRTVKIVAACAVMAAALYGCSSKSEAQAPPAPSVTVAVPLVQAVQDWDEFTGRFEATQSVEVRARVGGYITGVHFRDGDYVRRGQLLFSLDPRPAQAALASARAQLSQAQAQLTLAQSELERAETLLEAQAVSQAEVDTRRGALQTAQAAIAAANANVRARQLDLEFTRVTAPISGRVSDRRVDAGNLVAGGSSAADVLTTVVSSAPIHFVFDASEAVLLKYQRQARRSAAPIQVRLQDETTFTRSGTLDFTDNAVDTASGVVRLRAVIANADGFLKPGMFGQARLAGAGVYDAMLVPDAAIATDQARRIVYVVAGDGSVMPKPVQLGPLVDGLRVVRSGLEPTDRVIINGVQRIQQPGMKVQPRNGQIRPVAREAQVPVTQAAPASTATLANSLPSGD
ncbi:efflux RND transporter periplasmic adaptor subunit [Brevundimonas basaltis]|uniref:RND family efflux transporter MFP subunit n=1 Tax=Brevundimonas basaltis TaxID=472166 RepID=A0A7W8HZ87_9CAUL|nr:efflux RND transporter periplasmic adaptor subunit [Brevundimonas basaltis]MBB5292626.1 RND family efflux transporter MFP subunit [Brevundimonas basaltis]